VISLKFFDNLTYYELFQKVYPAIFSQNFSSVLLLIFLRLLLKWSNFQSLYNKAEKASEKERGMTNEETWGCARLEGVRK